MVEHIDLSEEQKGVQSKSRPESSDATTNVSENDNIISVHLNSFQIITIVVALLITASVSFLGGVVYDRQTGVASSDEFEVFWEAWNFIDSEYYQEPPSVTERVYGGITGVVSTLDQFSNVSPPVQAEQNREFIAGKFGGIGAQVSINENQEPYIVDVIRDACTNTTPADRAGLQANDVIRAVDGQEVVGWAIEDVVDIVKGDPGTDVVLTILRPDNNGDGEEMDITIRRDAVDQITVHDAMLDDVGYLYLESFNHVSSQQMQCKLELIMDENPRAIIFDLRGNGGGLLDESIAIADMFLDQGVVLIQRDRHGDEERHFSENGGAAEDIPLVVLINENSASASEVVAGALQDRGRAILIGKTSYGKGSVQLVHELSDGGELRVTSAAWYTPTGKQIHEIGLTPDILVEGALIDAEGNDLAVQAAMDYLDQHFPSDSAPSAQISPETEFTQDIIGG
jgi:carboxyl-terminal processing protease